MEGNPSSAVGRPVGSFSVDDNGLARYSFKIDVPEGISKNSTPEISLEYAQGLPNGILGVGWSLSGTSAIRLGAAKLPSDSPNYSRVDYDRSQPRYFLNGRELLTVWGQYGVPGAYYKPELDPDGQTVNHADDGGFIVEDFAGDKYEYGTTPESRIFSDTQGAYIEWHLTKRTDRFGNSVSYDYVAHPSIGASALQDELKDSGSIYLQSATYSSNERTGYQGKRLVLFEYGPRPDPIVRSSYGHKANYAQRLAKIRVAANLDSGRVDLRSYKIQYRQSSITNLSLLSSITEFSRKGRDLVPTEFTYSGETMAKSGPIFRVDNAISTLQGTRNNISIVPLNISGRGLTDLACLRYQTETKQLSLKTYLAEKMRDDRGELVLKWKPSLHAGGEASLPILDLSGDNTRMRLVAADLNGDGRTDLVIPYCTVSGELAFSISQSLGTGFSDHVTKRTGIAWQDEATFMSTDLSGEGRNDIIQIFPFGKNLAFRLFSAVGDNELSSVQYTDEVRTTYLFENTVSWLDMRGQLDGSRRLVRIWSQAGPNLTSTLHATSFRFIQGRDGRVQLEVDNAHLLSSFSNEEKKKITVLQCDINGDGVEDLVICAVDIVPVGSDRLLKMSYTTFLNDGCGRFAQHGKPRVSVMTLGPEQAPPGTGSFRVTNFYGSEYPSIAYVYQSLLTRDLCGLVCQGSSTGFVGDVQWFRLADRSRLPGDAGDILGADLFGNNLSGFLLYSIENDTAQVTSVYNQMAPTDDLITIRDPLGAKTRITYSPMTDTNVYTAGINWWDYPAQGPGSDFPLIASPWYIVSRTDTENDASINSLPYSCYEEFMYENAQVNLKGRGWQGFRKISMYNSSSDSTRVETFNQQWPFTGTTASVTILQGKFDTGAALQTIEYSYKPRTFPAGSYTLCRVNKSKEVTTWLSQDGGSRQTSSEFEHDFAGMVLVKKHTGSNGSRVITRFRYTSFGFLSLPERKKVSTSESNLDFDVFEAGDLSLQQFEYTGWGGSLYKSSAWSSDTSSFVSTVTEHDDYGKRLSTLDPAGLLTTVTYEETFNTHPIRVDEVGPGVQHQRKIGYDSLSGDIFAERTASGTVVLTVADEWGRRNRVIKSTAKGEAPQYVGTLLLKDIPFISTAEFRSALGVATLGASSTLGYERVTSASGKMLLLTRSKILYKDGQDGVTEIQELVDCVGQVRKRGILQGPEDGSWQAFEFDSRGLQTLRSYPVKLPSASGSRDAWDWYPDKDATYRKECDALGRDRLVTTPGHGGTGSSVMRRTEYLDGGRKVRSVIESVAAGQEGSKILSTKEHRAELFNGVEKTVMSKNEIGQATGFNYDPLGRLIIATDPAGKTETRAYNSMGKLTEIRNVYQGTVKRKYNESGWMVEETNGAGETTTYAYDCKGRVLQRTLHDGYLTLYTYDEGLKDTLSTIRDKKTSWDSTLEYLEKFEYNAKAKVTKRTLSLSATESYVVTSSYDWQDQEVLRTLPDGTRVSREFKGSLLKSLTSDHPAHKLTVTYGRYSATGKPEQWAIERQESGPGSSGSTGFVHTREYDTLGFPVEQTLKSGEKILASRRYTWNELDQLFKAEEGEDAGGSTDYLYEAGRLTNCSDPVNGSTGYTYDESGNVTSHGERQFTYTNNKAIALNRGSVEATAEYDAAGRLVRRTVEDKSDFNFHYDSMSKLRSMVNNKTGSATRITYNAQGETLFRRLPDGSREVRVSPDYEVVIQPNKSKRIQRRLFGPDGILGTVWHETPTPNASPTVHAEIFFTDTKGSITHIFDVAKTDEASSVKKRRYSPFGVMTGDDKDLSNTYEGRRADEDTHLLDFNARWYDPLFCRFTTPDNITDEPSMQRVDGLNRYAFENNDPVNHIDPTGHWSWQSILAIVVSVVVAVVAAVATVATGGAAASLTPFLASLVSAASSAWLGAGIAGAVFAAKYHDREGKDFWKGWGASVAIGFGTGFVTGFVSGAFGAWIGTAGTSGFIASPTSRLAADVAFRAVALGPGDGLIDRLGANGISRDLMGDEVSLADGLRDAALIGMASSAAVPAAKRLGARARNVWRGANRVRPAAVAQAADDLVFEPNPLFQVEMAAPAMPAPMVAVVHPLPVPSVHGGIPGGPNMDL